MFRNYCIVVMGDTLGSQEEIMKVSEIKPNVLDAKGILIATFSCIIEPSELTEWFISRNRSFLLFDLNETSSGFNITKKEIHEGLFGFLKNLNVDQLNEDFLRSIQLSSETKVTKAENKKTQKEAKNKNLLDKAKIEKMSNHEKDELLNQLIDNGLEKLSEHDKTLLYLLAK
jgi:hypothetical protein